MDLGDVALKLKKLLEPEAKERKREGGKKAGNGRKKKDVENLPQPKSKPKSRDQAAAMLGISESASRSQLARARSILQKLLKENDTVYEQ